MHLSQNLGHLISVDLISLYLNYKCDKKIFDHTNFNQGEIRFFIVPQRGKNSKIDLEVPNCEVFLKRVCAFT